MLHQNKNKSFGNILLLLTLQKRSIDGLEQCDQVGLGNTLFTNEHQYLSIFGPTYLEIVTLI